MADQNRMMNFHSSILQVASIIKNNEQIKIEENNEMEKKKRDRKANYSKEETDKLVDIVMSKIEILENKKNGSEQWQEKKQAWIDIEKAFNKNTSKSNYRDTKTLKIKYESIKRDLKKKWADIIANKRNSNGKLPKFTTAEMKIKDMLNLPIDGYCDFSLLEKSDGDNDDDSSDSNSDSKDLAWRSVKKEIEQSDDESPNQVEKNRIMVEFTRLNEGEPPSKKAYEDPLTPPPQVYQYKCNNNLDADEEKLQTFKLRNELLREELGLKKLQKTIMEEELQQKRVMYELEKEHLKLKIQMLKKGDENEKEKL